MLLIERKYLYFMLAALFALAIVLRGLELLNTLTVSSLHTRAELWRGGVS